MPLFKFRRPKKLDMAQFTPVSAGDDVYVVGGAVRDALLGRPFDDIDWLVRDPESAARQQANALVGSVFPLDETRGHWRVVLADGQVRDFIRLAGDLKTNLTERDFTVNALAVNQAGDLIDPLNGLGDLRKGQIRMISRDNLFADPLRCLRAVRLGMVLGFKLESATRSAISACAVAQQQGTVVRSAPERVAEELNKILLSVHAGQGFLLLEELGLLALYLPELAVARQTEQGGYHHLDVLGHSLEALNQLVQGFPEADLNLRWATLLHDVGKPDTKTVDETGKYYHFLGHDKLGANLTRTILQRLRQPAERVKRASALVRYHMVQLPSNKKAARRFVHRRRELLPALLQLMLADREAARGHLSSEVSRKAYRLAVARVLEVLSEPPPAAPLLSGREIMLLLNLREGPDVGKAVRFLAQSEAVGDATTRVEAEALLKQFAEKQLGKGC